MFAKYLGIFKNPLDFIIKMLYNIIRGGSCVTLRANHVRRGTEQH